jgi:hypothetical protein
VEVCLYYSVRLYWMGQIKVTFYVYCLGRDSSVGIATCYRLDGLGIESRWGTRFFAPLQTNPGAHRASTQ